MTPQRNAQLALERFDPLLVQLVQNDAPLRDILREGHSVFALRAVRTLAKRAGAIQHHRPVGDSTSRLAVTAGREAQPPIG